MTDIRPDFINRAALIGGDVKLCHKTLRTQKEDAGFNRERTIAAPVGADGGERIIRTLGGPACVAKNRFNLPAELPLSWDAFMQALAAPVQK